ncbi:MAG: deoxynucleoside kinase [Zetaproteobacteria bacterium]|nr:MAG: deoxynucleoside kinase [Zetaproteobacteria bacterium]
MVSHPFQFAHIAIEGPIGVGKTTLARKLADRLQASLVLENIDDNPFIQWYYEDPARHALSVQLSFLFSRLRQWQELSQQELFHQGRVISDYLFAKDRLFATITLTDAELALYDKVAHSVACDLPKPDLVIYLQAGLDSIMKRIRRRGRSFERNLDESYLQRVIAAYDRFFFHYDETPLLIVQTDRMNFAEDPAAIDSLIRRIASMRGFIEFWADLS